MEIKSTPREIADSLISSFSDASRHTKHITLQYDIKCAIITCNKLLSVTRDPIYELVLEELYKQYN